MKRAIASDLGLEPPFNYFSWGITSKNRMEEEDKERRRTGKRKKRRVVCGRQDCSLFKVGKLGFLPLLVDGW